MMFTTRNGLRQAEIESHMLHISSPVFSFKMNLLSPEASVRQVFCVFLFLTGVSLFGTIIAQTNSIILQLSRDGVELANRLERYTSFMRHYRCKNMNSHVNCIIAT